MTDRISSESNQKRRWRLWQVETAMACNLSCVMCPWKDERHQNIDIGIMSEEVWAELRPHLSQTNMIDFTGGGEPLLQPNLANWIQEANCCGCQTGFLTNGQTLDEKAIQLYIESGLDWIGFSMDGANAATYEKIRKGADFENLCRNIRRFAELRKDKKPLIMINFVMMSSNIHQLKDLVKLVAKLGADQINFKHCDVVRNEHGRGFALFKPDETKEIRRLQKAMKKAQRLAKKRKLQTTAFKSIPDELPVCAQDPRDSLFIGYDGRVAPCINLAYGGHSLFLGDPVDIPTIQYGNLLEKDVMDIWRSESCRFYRDRFVKRDQAYDRVISSSFIEPSMIRLQETLEAARQAMPAAPEGCHTCHYLYNI